MTLEEVEQRIYDFYQWYAREAPGVKPKEHGLLGILWSKFDLLIN